MTGQGACFHISGGVSLEGECEISTSKNAVLPILAACMLTKEPVVIDHVPAISDVQNMIWLLKSFGINVSQREDSLTITARSIITTSPTAHLMGQLRASFLFMGPLLAREGTVTMPLPGGCRIGARPIDLHLQGFKALGARAITANGSVHAWGSPLKGADIHLRFPSVGATENIMMAAVLAKGTTRIYGAAVEPEVMDLAGFLNAMGARVSFGSCIEIEGVSELHGTHYTPIPDRIEAGTLMLAAAASGGDVRLKRASEAHLGPVRDKLIEAGAEIFPFDGGLCVRGHGIRPMEIISSPYPGFPTDMQAQFLAACCLANGKSTVSETIFENRFLHVDELKKMGADITVSGNTATIAGNGRLHGAQVSATDLRAGAALCIAAMLAQGETLITDIHHLDRGYENFEAKLRALGARIKRLS